MYSKFFKLIKIIYVNINPSNFFLFVKRKKVESVLKNLQFSEIKKSPINGNILIDGIFDNPNYWFRYYLIKSALNLQEKKQIGIVGKYNKFKVKSTLKNFGVRNLYLFYNSKVSFFRLKKTVDDIYNFLSNNKSLKNLVLPYGFPPEIFHDGILRRQGKSSIDYDSYDLKKHITEFVYCLEVAKHIIEYYNPKLVLLSHAVNFDCGSLAWFSIKKNIPTVVLYGEYGTLRFWRPSKRKSIFMNGNFINSNEIKLLNNTKQKTLSKIGGNYLDMRLNAKVKDLGAKKAFHNLRHVTRKEIYDHFNWDVKKKIIAVYSVSWIDFPHLHGKNLFSDCGEWLRYTLDKIIKNTKVNWIIKRHPLESYYNSGFIEDFFSQDLPSNVGVYPQNWSGNSLIKNVDGLVTFMGTAGIEAASLKKIVVTGTKGWYGDSKFVFYPKTKKEYFNFLNSNWIVNQKILNLHSTRAKQFACWHFCAPGWQKNFVMNDDFDNEKNYDLIYKKLNENKKEIKKEVEMIGDWYFSKFDGYHSYKMYNADNYSLANAIV